MRKTILQKLEYVRNRGFTQKWRDEHLLHTMPKRINRKFNIEKSRNYSQLKHLDVGIFPAAYTTDLRELQLTEISSSLIIFTKLANESSELNLLNRAIHQLIHQLLRHPKLSNFYLWLQVRFNQRSLLKLAFVSLLANH